MAISPLIKKDLKWIFGILAFLSLLPAVFFGGIYQATKAEPAKKITSGLLIQVVEGAVGSQTGQMERAGKLPSEEQLGGFLKDQGQASVPPDAKTAVDGQMKAQIVQGIKKLAAANPSQQLSVPNLPLPITLKGEDILKTPDDKILSLVTENVAENIYNDPEAMAKLAEQDPVLGRIGGATAGLLSEQTNAFAGSVQISLWIPAVILLIIAGLFGRGSGRLATPGIIIVLASLPAALLYSTLGAVFIASSAADDSSRLYEGLRLASVGASKQALLWFTIGIVLIVGSLIWAIIRKFTVSKDKASEAPTQARQAPDQPQVAVTPPAPSE